jgi:CheY-like chemotaxis protein
MNAASETGPTLKVLIVDDTPANLRLLRAVLEGENFEVVKATDGVQDLAVLEGGTIDAVRSFAHFRLTLDGRVSKLRHR